MDILYIIGEGCSQCNNNELRYSLRSIEKYGKGVDRVFVAGYCPEWLSDEVIKVPCKQPYKKKAHAEYENQDNLTLKHVNMLYTILYTVDNTDIGEEFLISMDDHIYIRDVDFNNYPFYCKVFRPYNYLPKVGNTQYRRFLAKTRNELEKQNLPVYYMSLHRNMHVCRRDIEECREYLNKVVSEPIALEGLAYLNNYRIGKHGDCEIIPVIDVKLHGGCDWWKANPRETEVISTYDFKENKGLDVLLRGLFNKKSKYENE